MNPNTSAAITYGVNYTGNGMSVEPGGIDGGVMTALLAIIVGCIVLLRIK